MDSQFGRFRREFLAQQPSMFSIGRVKTLAQAQKCPAAKKQQLAEHVIGMFITVAWLIAESSIEAATHNNTNNMLTMPVWSLVVVGRSP